MLGRNQFIREFLFFSYFLRKKLVKASIFAVNLANHTEHTLKIVARLNLPSITVFFNFISFFILLAIKAFKK